MQEKLLFWRNRNNNFKNHYFKKFENRLTDLVKYGQHPKALFIGCSDSRVIPNLITQTDPGDLFIIRNVGNFVPPFSPNNSYHAVASAIEYAVEALKVEEIIVCGHTHCGAINSLYTGLDEKSFVHTKRWLALGSKAKEMAVSKMKTDEPTSELLRLTEKYSVITQIENLLTYPTVKEKVETGEIIIHGWIYDLETGGIEYFDMESKEFKPFEQNKEQ
ncbi:carbonic anhydrase [Nitratiruptor sp. SB155-2]|uniref:carbonic anhydrase n=1 Tax=Nitratiruptor sp. (strain SB155-2) TaxID=387092 RepID=UPI0001586DDB|nr:carbonic anhydrase [Nitratiruptor sp. SB155-2]BAF69423.1 carbonate dehydratase [Nitratiruptor sp. SB155-2]